MSKWMYSVVILTLLTITGACSRNGGTEQNTPDETDTISMLVKVPWNIVEMGYDLDENGTIELPHESSLNDCDRDNRYYFYADGQGKVDEHLNVCSGHNNEYPFRWAFDSTRTHIFINGLPMRIEKLDRRNLVLKGMLTSAGRQIIIYKRDI